jgi:hypothetical protein
MTRTDSTRFNRSAEEEYHLSHPHLFYRQDEEILTSKNKKLWGNPSLRYKKDSK